MDIYNDDKIEWKKGQEFEDGSTILMVERIGPRAPSVARNGANCEMCLLSLFPCVWCCYCPLLCNAKGNMETQMQNSSLLVTDESIIFYENEWTPKYVFFFFFFFFFLFLFLSFFLFPPKFPSSHLLSRGTDCYIGALPSKKFTITYDQLQDVRMDPQGFCETCCVCLNPGPGIQVSFLSFDHFFFFLPHPFPLSLSSHCPPSHLSLQFYPVGYIKREDSDGNGIGYPPPTWQPYSVDEDELREKKKEIEQHWMNYKEEMREARKRGIAGGVGRVMGGTTTGGQNRAFCGDCGEKNELSKKFCGGCGANLES